MTPNRSLSKLVLFYLEISTLMPINRWGNFFVCLLALPLFLFTLFSPIITTHAEPVQNLGEAVVKATLVQPITKDSSIIYNHIQAYDAVDGHGQLVRFNEVLLHHDIKEPFGVMLGGSHARIENARGEEEWAASQGVYIHLHSEDKSKSLFSHLELVEAYRPDRDKNPAMLLELRISPRVHFGKGKRWMFEGRIEPSVHLDDQDWRQRGLEGVRVYPNLTYKVNEYVSVRGGYVFAFVPNSPRGDAEIVHAARVELFVTNPVHLIEEAAHHVHLKPHATPSKATALAHSGVNLEPN